MALHDLVNLHKSMEQQASSPTLRKSDTEHVSSPEFRSGDSTKRKTVVFKDLQYIPVVSIKYFKDAILPKTPITNIANVRDSLIKSSLWTEDKGWARFYSEPGEDSEPREYPLPEPSNDSRLEEVVFEGVGRVFDDVVKAAKQVSPQLLPTLELISEPSKSPSSHRLNTARPDAYLLMKQRKSIPKDPTDDQDSWDDIAVSFEFKKHTGSADRISVSLCTSPHYTPTYHSIRTNNGWYGTFAPLCARIPAVVVPSA